MVKKPPANAGDTGSIPDLGGPPRAGEQMSSSATATEPAQELRLLSSRAPAADVLTPQSPRHAAREAAAVRSLSGTAGSGPAQHNQTKALTAAETQQCQK